MSTAYLATDVSAPHDIYLELLEVTNAPSSAFGGRPDIFVVVSLERGLSAPQTVAKAAAVGATNAISMSGAHGDGLVRTGRSDHSAAPSVAVGGDGTTMSYAKYTVGSTAAAEGLGTAPGGHAIGSAAAALLPSSLSHGGGEGSSDAHSSLLGTASVIRVGRTPMVTDAPVTCNLEAKLCIAHCHDREVLRLTLYDRVESARGFLGTAIVPVGGPLREFGARVVRLEGPTDASLRIAWEVVDPSTVKGQHLTATFAAAAGGHSGLGLVDSLGGFAASPSQDGSVAQSPSPAHPHARMLGLKARMEATWRDRYGSAVQQVSAKAGGGGGRGGAPSVPVGEDVPAPSSLGANEPIAANSLPISASAAASLPESQVADQPPAQPQHLYPTTGAGGAATHREAHLEQRVRDLEDALLAFAKNRDDTVQRELLRRVAGGEVNVFSPPAPSPLSVAAANGSGGTATAGGGGGGSRNNLMALTVSDLTRVASQGHGTLSHALAQSAAREQLATLLGVEAGQIGVTVAGVVGATGTDANGESAAPSPLSGLGSGIASTTVAALRAAREREALARNEPQYYSPSLMAPVGNEGNASVATTTAVSCGNSNAVGGGASESVPSLATVTREAFPNLADIIANPSRPLDAAEDTLLRAYRGPRALYESDRTQLQAAGSVLFGSQIRFPSLLPHHGNALAASYILGTDTVTSGMAAGLPPLLASAGVTSSMPLSYAKNSLKFRPPSSASVSAVGGGRPPLSGSASSFGASVSAAASPNSPASPTGSRKSMRRGAGPNPFSYIDGDTFSPLSPAKRAASAAGSGPYLPPHPLTAVAVNNTVLNDAAVAAMYPTSTRIAASDPHFQDNTEAWRRALAHRDTAVAVEGTGIVRPHS